MSDEREPEAYYSRQSAIRTGLACRCPRCGMGKLYDGFLTVAPKCSVCGLALAEHDAGDGPAVFIIMILGFVVVGLALWVEVTFTPPLWVHAVLWPPVILGGALGMLRPLKGIMIANQYKHIAEDFEGPDDAR